MGRIKRGVGRGSHLQTLLKGGVAQRPALPANRSRTYSAFNFMQAFPRTPYMHCEKVAQLEENVTGLSADTRLGFGDANRRRRLGRKGLCVL